MKLNHYNFLNKTTASLFLLAVFLAAVYLLSGQFDFSKIALITLEQSSVLLGLALLNLMSQGVIFKYSIKGSGINLSFKEWFGSTNITLFSNYVIPFSGFGFRAYYLNKKHNLPYLDFSSSLIAILLVEMLVFSTFGVVAFFLSKYTIWSNIFYMTLILILVGSLLFFIPAFVLLIERALNLFKIKIKFNSWLQYIKTGKELAVMFIYTIVSAILFVLLFHISIYIITGLYDLKAAVLMAVAGNLGMYLRVTPAAIGTFEGGITLIGLLFGIGVGDSILISLCIRLAFIPLFFTLGPFYTWLFLGRFIPYNSS